MQLRTVGVMCLAGCLAMGGCDSSKDRPPQAPAQASAESGSTGSPLARPADPDRKQKVQIAGIKACARKLTTAPVSVASTQPAGTAPDGEYLDAIKQTITDAADRAQKLSDGAGKLSPQREDNLEVLLKAFDVASGSALERLDELAESPRAQWPAKKAQLEQALGEQQQACDRLQDWLASIGGASERQPR